MAFVSRSGRFYVVSTFGWERPRTMVVTGAAWADAEDTKRLRNILRGETEYAP